MSSGPFVAKAWRYPVDQKTWDGYKSLELRDITIEPPKGDEVLVKLHATSLNYSQGNYPGKLSTGPDGQGLIPTCDGAGEIVTVGGNVTKWKVGDRVHSVFYEKWLSGPIKTEYLDFVLGSTSSGCLTQYQVFHSDTILPIPDHLSYEEAATLPCAAVTSWNALFQKQPITKDSTVLVLGSGGVSVAGAQLAKAAGARVIATTSSKDKAEKYKALGVDEKVKELTGGEGVERVLDVGGQGTLIQSIKSIKREGVVNVIGFLGQGNSNETLNDLAVMLVFGQGTLSAIAVGSKEMNEKLNAFLAEHKIKPVVDRVFGWNEAIEALDYQFGGSHFGKVVIKIE
ncbi:hypothetical protein FRC09_009974 [Ceratobasidium sp. 395]|nr:hypothetical protein FRC09_009974 [Ceratobasidium sp. 395]